MFCCIIAKFFPNSPAPRLAPLNAKFGDALLLKLADEKNAAPSRTAL